MTIDSIIQSVKEKGQKTRESLKKTIGQKIKEFKEERAEKSARNKEYKKKLSEERHKAKLESTTKIAKEEIEAEIERRKLKEIKPKFIKPMKQVNIWSMEGAKQLDPSGMFSLSSTTLPTKKISKKKKKQKVFNIFTNEYEWR